MSNIYCGNNAKSTDILSGNKVIGTRYNCMRKGIGKGLHLPVDNNYLGDYEPIDTRKIYCGNAENLPDGYDLMGSLPQCLQKGIGIGKKQKAENGNQSHLMSSFFSDYKIIIYITIYIILCVSIFLVLYFTKPDFISDKKNNKNVINTKKLLLYYISIIAVIGIIMFIVAKFT
jgi:hypothetical protein